MTITTELTTEQARKICFDHLVNQMIVMKQYMDVDEFKNYKFILSKIGSLIELAQVERDFNRAWPQDLVWEDL